MIAALGFRNETSRRAFDGVFKSARKGFAIEAGRDRIEHFDDDRAGKAQQRTARPDRARN